MARVTNGIFVLLMYSLFVSKPGISFHRFSQLSSSCKRKIQYNLRKRRDTIITSLTLSSTSSTQDIIKEGKEDYAFDLQLALLLAGFSFEAYNERTIGKKTIGLDNTVVNFTSSSFIRSIFSGKYKFKWYKSSNSSNRLAKSHTK